MALNEEATMSSSKGGSQEAWRDVLQANLDALFQLALLLTADSQEAEDNLAAVISTLDFSQQPDEDALAVIQAALARQSIGSGGVISLAGVAEARSCFNPVYCLFSSWSAFPVSLFSICCSDIPRRLVREGLASTKAA